MDSLSYNYNGGTNQLNYVRDRIGGATTHSANYTEDVEDQALNNYTYDAIGNLTKDTKESITSIVWNLYGKIKTINRTATTANKAQVITYHYDGNGNRVGKTVQKYNAPNVNTWYVLDAQGNTLAVYEKTGGLYNDLGPAYLKEHHLYGASRLGIIERNQNLDSAKTTPVGANDIGATYGYVYERGRKYYELTNHLGNVLATITDKRIGHNGGNGTYDYYEADIASAQDYYPFGMPMPGRKFAGLNGYRYGFNGKEEDDEVKGDGNQIAYENRIYDPRLGRWFSLDPLQKNILGKHIMAL